MKPLLLCWLNKRKIKKALKWQKETKGKTKLIKANFGVNSHWF
jgi:hypothetical protein